jgi:hypothetical protein
VATFIFGYIPRNQNCKQDGARFFISPPSISFLDSHLFTKVSIQLITIVPDLLLPNGMVVFFFKNFGRFTLKDCQDFHQAKDGDGWVEQSSQPFLFGLLQKVCAIGQNFVCGKGQ